jgi:glycosyltransferase involved in cell wall biosynthesis
MKILFSLLHYNCLTGSGLYVYEITKELKKRGYDITILARDKGGIITEKSIELGIGVYKFDEFDYKQHFDLIHSNQNLPTKLVVEKYPNTPIVTTIHSEFIYEQPFIHNNIKKYICIRPTIKEHLVNNFNINEEKCEIIYNGVDFTRFNKENTEHNNKKKIVLFVGTIDHLRRLASIDIINNSINNGKKVFFIGDGEADFINGLKDVNHINSLWDIEEYVKICDETAGILLGRTTIEGWVCGKSGWIYDIDSNGNILSKNLYHPPEDIDKYNIINVVNLIEVVYKF